RAMWRWDPCSTPTAFPGRSPASPAPAAVRSGTMSAPSSASGSAAAGLRISPRTVLAAVVVATLVVRLAVGAIVPLTEDEAYYRLWSMRPAFGYFDRSEEHTSEL